MWTFEEKLAGVLGVAFVLITAIGMAAYRRNDTLALKREHHLTTHSSSVIELTERVLSEMTDSETGQRGFVITGDESYLEPFINGSAAVAGTMTELRKLTADNSGHQTRLDETERLIGGRLDELRRTIGLRRAQGFEATQREILHGQGKRYMDDLRRVIEQMERDERALLKQRVDDIEASASRARTKLGFGTLVCMILSAAVVVFLSRSLVGPIGSAMRHSSFQSAPQRRVDRTSWRRSAPRSALRAPSSRF